MPDWLRRLARNPLGLAGLALIGLCLLLVVLGPSLAPHDPERFNAGARLQGPSATFLFGTDHFGRDTLSRMLHGARSTILFGVVATLIGTVGGVLIGLAAGYAGGWIDEIVMRLSDAKMAIPNLLFSLLILTALGVSPLNAVLAVGIAFMPSIARVARSVTLGVRHRDYVGAAIARGERGWYIAFREMLPNVLAPVIVEATIRVSFAVMLGATLSFLGLGAQPPASDWGLMIAEARNHMFRNPWLVVWPGFGISLIAIGFNLFGDGLRDALNPRLGG
jgi:peptide/nickel transport system permease protein